MPDEKKKEDKALTLEGVQHEVLSKLGEIKEQWKAHYDELKQLGCDIGKRQEDVEKKADNAVRRVEEAEGMLKNPAFVSRSETGEIKSIGDTIMENEAIKTAFQNREADFRGKLRIPIENLNIDVTPLESGMKMRRGGTFFPYQFALAGAMALVPELKTTITSAAVGSGTSGVLMPTRIPGIVAPPQPRIRVRDIIPRFPTTANAIDWVKENTFSEVVSPQTEGSAKGESEITFTVDTETVRTIATWIPASRQILDDFVGLGAFLNQRLLDALMNEEDDQILRGDDTGQNLKGLSQAATAYVDATYDQTGDTVLDKLARMMTQLEENNYTPSAFILHPRNWRIITTIKADYGGGTGTGPYVLGGPGGISGTGGAMNSAWGLPVATTSRMTAGNAFCGDFLGYVTLWDRMVARIDISTEHASFFTQNLVAIRAEERVCLTVRDNNAVIYESSL